MQNDKQEVISATQLLHMAMGQRFCYFESCHSHNWIKIQLQVHSIHGLTLATAPVVAACYFQYLLVYAFVFLYIKLLLEHWKFHNVCVAWKKWPSRVLRQQLFLFCSMSFFSLVSHLITYRPVLQKLPQPQRSQPNALKIPSNLVFVATG